VAVTGNQGGTAHVPVATLAIGSSPQWVEPDMIEVWRQAAKRKGFVRVKASCPAASPTRYCQGWIKLRGGRHNRVLVAAHKYKLGRGATRVLSIRRKRTRAKAKVIFATPFSCPGKLKTCRSWQNL
jgi:hypothetical protein